MIAFVMPYEISIRLPHICIQIEKGINLGKACLFTFQQIFLDRILLTGK
uniref:Uncharacterized protein n=1 Tax=uncultured bacterium contig00111 TaxID=1181575 RepID=A0A806KLT0_9BACT|nr:hypothetical protein [uncultured bacterium contig00111]